jgi:glycosyltransferase involved in cell wall biosynthesis
MNLNVSVIIPTYNRASLLERALRSVLSQTYEDFEIIIVDDLSTDNTQEMVESKFIQEIRSGIIRYVKNDRKRERSFSRNRAIEMARGKYIAYLDDDDIWLPEHLKILVGYLEEHKDIGCVFSNYAMIGEDDSSELGVKNLEFYRGFSYGELCILGVLAQTSTVVFRRDIYSKIGGFREDLNRGENREFCSRIALNYPIHYIGVVTCHQYVHKGSYSHLSPQDYAYSREKIWKLTEENSIKFNFSLTKEVIGRAYRDIAWFFLPNVLKAREYLFRAIKKDKKLLIKLNTYKIMLRLIFGQKFYSVLKKLRKIVSN